MYDKLVAKGDNIDTSNFVLKAKYQSHRPKRIRRKIPNFSVTNFVKEAKLTQLENKITDISNLATKTALTNVENKLPSVSNLLNKTNYNTNY